MKSTISVAKLITSLIRDSSPSYKQRNALHKTLDAISEVKNEYASIGTFSAHICVEKTINRANHATFEESLDVIENIHLQWLE